VNYGAIPGVILNRHRFDLFDRRPSCVTTAEVAVGNGVASSFRSQQVISTACVGRFHILNFASQATTGNADSVTSKRGEVRVEVGDRGAISYHLGESYSICGYGSYRPS